MTVLRISKVALVVCQKRVRERGPLSSICTTSVIVAPIMAKRDNERERQRLVQHYAGMGAEQLREIAEDASSLTDDARAALRAEFARRGLTVALEDTEPAQPPGGPIVLRRYLWLADALLAKSILDSAGIECVLADEHTIRMDWFWSVALGEVKLWVREEDVADSATLLDQGWIESFMVSSVDEYFQPRCPNCGSLEISYRQLLKRLAYWGIALFWLLSFVPPLAFREPAWRCYSCGYAWEDETDTKVHAIDNS